MRRVPVDGTTLCVRTYGPATGEPVLLLHGAGADGPADWRTIAPVLAARRRVIVPDLRGHGRSPDPAVDYRFSRMAGDVEALVHAMGYDRVHLVGHSNGGNVALVTLLEHPEVVATCVIQGGNAWVSPDLAASCLLDLDPSRIEVEEPAWRDELVRLHDRWQGPGAWRALLAATARETASAPSYTPLDLAGVARPVLVIEGMDDRLNARAGHGSFIARHVPDAQLWRPAHTGHRVHVERPGQWLTTVERFWHERGDAARDRLWRLGQGPYRDRRTAVFDLTLAEHAGAPDRVRVLEPAEVRAVRHVAAAPPGRLEVRAIRPRVRPGRAGVPVVDVLAAPDPEAPRLTQALFGEALEILDRRDAFARVRLAADGYLGWARAVHLRDVDPTPTHRVDAACATLFLAPDGEAVTRLPFGALVAAHREVGEWTAVTGPGAARRWARTTGLRQIGAVLDVEGALARTLRFVGVPYLWGGRSAWGWDCSGLAQAFLAARGIAVGRDCDMQWAQGEEVTDTAARGDLVFFADPAPEGRVASHVAIALGADQILHALGAAGRVLVSDVALASKAPGTPRGRRLLGVRRYAARPVEPDR